MNTRLKHLTGTLLGISSLCMMVLITIYTFIPILVIGLFKLFPNEKWRIYCTKQIDERVVNWSGLNGAYIDRVYNTPITITGNTKFDPKQWYLVIANHQSWLDIVVLQYVFHKKIPVLKFFVKEELKWLPLFGFAWWAMGLPFMKRYSKEYLQKNPHKKGTDLQATDKALKLFKSYPSTIINFVEGTRYTSDKKQYQQSPYQHLLKPKAGGINQVIKVLSNQLQPIIDVTIVYGCPKHSLWDFLCHRVNTVHVNINTLALPETSKHTANENEAQQAFRTWLNDQWLTKDALITTIKIGESMTTSFDRSSQ